MVKSSLDQGFWLEVAKLARHLCQKPRYNDDFTIHGQ